MDGALSEWPNPARAIDRGIDHQHFAGSVGLFSDYVREIILRIPTLMQ